MNKIFCDACDTEIGTKGQANFEQCDECPGHEKQYHVACLVPLYGKKWCPIHVVGARNDQVIREYVTSMWKDVGFEGQIQPSNGKITSIIGPLNILIEPKYDRQSVNLQFVTLEISGLAEKTRKIKSNIHSHSDAVLQLRGALVRSLRSSKSAITIQKKALEERTGKIDVIIVDIMATLGGVLPDAQVDDENKANEV